MSGRGQSTNQSGTVDHDAWKTRSDLPNMTIDDMFARGQPKHGFQGASQGYGNLFTGVELGLGTLAAAPLVGAYHGGIRGGVEGLTAGVLAAPALAGYGGYAGARQFARGIKNTPEACEKMVKQDELWDSTAGVWVAINLKEDCADLPASDEDIDTQARKLYNERVKCIDSDTKRKEEENQTESGKANTTDYYAYMGVSKTATQEEIRKAYMRKALELHPDKHPDDPDATRKFQELQQIYSVLSDVQRRAAYDRNGTAAVDDSAPTQQVDNPIAEAIGVRFVEPLVGRLRFLLYFQTECLYTKEMLQELHRRRRLRIARMLCDYLDYEESGLARARTVMKDAVSTPAGPALLAFAADAYCDAARQYNRGDAFTREADAYFTTRWAALRTDWNTSLAASKAMYSDCRDTLSEEHLVDLIAAANEYDVRHVVTEACRLVLHDHAVPLERRKSRARQLEKLSTVAMEEVDRELTSRKEEAQKKRHSK